MIEDKTKEPQTAEPAQQPPKKRGQKLRSLWAQFQCMQLLRRHRFRRRTQHHVNHFSQKLLQNRLVLIVGEALYALGFSAEYAFVRVGRTVCRGVSGALLWGRACGTPSCPCVPRCSPDGARPVRAHRAVLPGHGLAAGTCAPRPEGKGLWRSRKGQRALSGRRRAAQCAHPAAHGHVYPAGAGTGPGWSRWCRTPSVSPMRWKCR